MSSCLSDGCSWNVNTCLSTLLLLKGILSWRMIDLIHGTDAYGGLISMSGNHT